MHDNGIFAGLLGYLLPVFVIPIILLLLIVDFVLYRKHKKKISQSTKYEEEPKK